MIPQYRVQHAMPAHAKKIIASKERGAQQDQVIRDQEQLARDHQRAQHQEEQAIPAWKLALGECVGSHRVKEHLHTQHDHCQETTIEDPAKETFRSEKF